MRLYTWTHFMLSPMAKGIQATHATVELFNKYKEIDLYDIARSTGENPPKYLVTQAKLGDILFDWSNYHKTMISLDGGVSPDLDELVKYFENIDLGLPWAYFKEDESLGELVTAVAIVVPESIYETAEALRKGEIVWDDEVSIFKSVELNGEVPTKHMNRNSVDFAHKLMNYRMAK